MTENMTVSASELRLLERPKARTSGFNIALPKTGTP